MRRSINIIIILLLFILFSACITKQETIIKETDTVKQPQKQDIKLVVKPVKIKYLQPNGIAVNHIDSFIDTSRGKIKLTLVQIDGLKNKDIENKINSDIEESIGNSIKNSIENSIENSYEKRQTFYTYVELNANNLMSINMLSDYSSYNEGFLYRLSDGKRLYLKDVFTEGTDYVPFLNQKIIEEILAGYDDEGDILREPFSTIAPNQAFIINESSLGIMFHKGEAGFARDYEIRIPLSEIDDYVDLLDKQEDLDKSIYEKPYDIVKYNNIFIRETNEIIQTEKGDVSLGYPIISGMRNPDIEKSINKIIRTAVDEILESYYIQEPYAQDISTFSQATEGQVTLNMGVSFNYYDYLCITWQRYLYSSQNELPNISLKTYTIDLRTGKLVDAKELLNNYANNNEAFKTAFTKKILDAFRTIDGNINIDNIEKHGIGAAYSFLLDNSIIYYRCYGLNDEPRIVILLKENLISPHTIESEAGFNTVLHTPPNLFFK